MLSHAYFGLHQLRRQSLEAPVTVPHELVIGSAYLPADTDKYANCTSSATLKGTPLVAWAATRGSVSVHSDAREVLSIRAAIQAT
jgi:hypothetical protein